MQIFLQNSKRYMYKCIPYRYLGYQKSTFKNMKKKVKLSSVTLISLLLQSELRNLLLVNTSGQKPVLFYVSQTFGLQVASCCRLVLLLQSISFFCLHQLLPLIERVASPLLKALPISTLEKWSILHILLIFFPQ